MQTVGPFEGARALGGNKYRAVQRASTTSTSAARCALLAFFDAGQSFLEGDPIDLRKLRTSTGLELRVLVPVLNVPFRLIYAVNPNRDPFQPKSDFKFGIGTAF